MNTPPSTSLPEPQDTPESAMEIITALASLPPQALISEPGLARLFKRHVTSVKRAVQREELPPPVPLFGVNVWTVEAILAHIRARLEAEQTAAAQTARRIQRLRPGQGGHH